LSKRQKELKSLIESCGLVVLNVDHTKSQHLKFRIKASDGREANFVTSNTPSCRRADMNNRSFLRRFAAESAGQGA
jgi:hypothetical protein